MRTIYRDIDALAAAGVPVYADRGAEGGYRLLDGYRVRLNGLLAGRGRGAVHGRPAGACRRARPRCRDDGGADQADGGAAGESAPQCANRLQQRFHLDAPNWFGEAEEPIHLRAIAGAVLRENLIEIRYQSWKSERRRRVAPLGLVLKGGSWYLAGLVDGTVRTYRVARVLDCIVLEMPFARPADFDLASYWRASIERLEAELHPNEATVRLSPLGLKLFDALAHPYVKARMRLADGTDADGWRAATIPVGKTVWHAASELLRLGAEVEVIAPDGLREKMAELTGAMAARYADAPPRRVAGRRASSGCLS